MIKRRQEKSCAPYDRGITTLLYLIQPHFHFITSSQWASLGDVPPALILHIPFSPLYVSMCFRPDSENVSPQFTISGLDNSSGSLALLSNQPLLTEPMTVTLQQAPATSTKSASPSPKAPALWGLTSQHRPPVVRPPQFAFTPVYVCQVTRRHGCNDELAICRVYVRTASGCVSEGRASCPECGAHPTSRSNGQFDQLFHGTGGVVVTWIVATVPTSIRPGFDSRPVQLVFVFSRCLQHGGLTTETVKLILRPGSQMHSYNPS